MRDGAVEVSEGRYRETFGRYLEDFTVGDVYEHRPGRTITDTDNIWFTLLTMNTHPAHFDYEYAKKTEFGKPLVCSPFTVALLVGMSVSDISQKAIATLGWGDIVTVKTTGKNQDGVVVCSYERSVLVWKRGFGPADD